MKIQLNIDREWKAVESMFLQAYQKGTWDGLKKGVNLLLIFLEARVKEKIISTFRSTPKITGQVTGVRAEGRLRSSWAREVKIDKNSVTGILGSSAKHARLMEKGGTIRPVHAKALTIPFLAATGGRIYPPAQDLRKQGLSILLKESGIIALKDVKGKKSTEVKLTPVYVLKQSAKIPARPYIEPVLREWSPRIVDLIGGEVTKQFKKR